MSNARLREALNAGNTAKEKGPPAADGVLSVTPDAPETAELRSRRSAIDCVATSSTYLEDEAVGPRPNELYGKFTWKIENFSETSKRELRSNVFEVGSYKWYILVYPQGCDVCNHLSLFLCVADYDKLLPGWSHFAQFTIAVVNKDPKKSKYSDTLHRFCKKEHDWGWKKFMELSKVLDGFTVADTLVIKAQVQVIRDRLDRPFRCLDPQYRRELVRVYLTNVEGICRRFVEERRERLAWIRQEPNAFRSFWRSLVDDVRKDAIHEGEDVILKGIVKRFFNEKEVTSTLVMDALFCGCRQLEEQSRIWLEGKVGRSDAPSIAIDAHQGIFFIAEDVIRGLERAANETIPPCGRDEKAADGSAMRSGQEDEGVKDTIERDERRLAELGKRTVEMYVISHIFTEHLEVAYREAESLKRQEALIREEEEAERMEEYKNQLKAEAEREKRMKRKEKKRAKKEAERAKRDAEEAERRIQEQVKQDERERKRMEEAEKKRKLDEEREVQHQKALEEAARRAREMERKEAEKVKRAQQSSVSVSKPTGSPSTSSSASNSVTSDLQPSWATPAVAPKSVEDRSVSSNDASSQPSSSPASIASAVESGRRMGVIDVLRPSSSCSVPQASGVNRSFPVVQSNHVRHKTIQIDRQSLVNGIEPSAAEINTLRNRVRALEKKLDDKDLEISRLQAQLSEYSAREKSSKESKPAVMQSSQGSQTYPQGHSSSEQQSRQDASIGTPESSSQAPLAVSVNQCSGKSEVAEAHTSTTTSPSQITTLSQNAQMRPSGSAIPGVNPSNQTGAAGSIPQRSKIAPAPVSPVSQQEQRRQETSTEHTCGQNLHNPQHSTAPASRPAGSKVLESDSLPVPHAPRVADSVSGTGSGSATSASISANPLVHEGPELQKTGSGSMYPRPPGGLPSSSASIGGSHHPTNETPSASSNKTDTSIPAAGHSPTSSQVPAPSIAPPAGHFPGSLQHHATSFGAHGHGGYPPLQPHQPIGLGLQAPIPAIPHGAHPGSASMVQVINGGVGPSGMAQKLPATTGHGAQPGHLEHVNSQTPRPRVMQEDSPIQMMNGPLRPYHGGAGGRFGLPPPRPIGSQGSPGRGCGPHEMIGPMPDGVGGSGLKNGEVGYMGSNHLMMHQQPQMPIVNNGIPVKRPDPTSRHSDTPCLDDFAHMGLITDLLE